MRLKILGAVLIALIVLIPSRETEGSCVAAELVNGGYVIITGEVKIPQKDAVITQAVEKAEMDKQTRKQRKADATDVELLAEVMYHENWYTDEDHLAAYYTGAVVMNRVNSDKWADTIRDILYQPGQYSTTKLFFTKKIPEECYAMARDIIENGTPDVPPKVIFQSMRKMGSGVWKKVNTDYFCYE